ncbi:hypothetical protein GCK72_011642 [Caenorhabditis remanei]|uniref:Uncharacterized protein n=1 Tax=Caenorhabditis remanei TaxID=31234 RepID=A0A6A5H929_CAERE|nr:hypothetical protein GCK72_011642 [Caenorhabditis remanei]KAF1763376.1 hypothetical protein GCK72_011642 [Caenorhabditis remanei]
MLITVQSAPNFNKLSWAENEKRLKVCGKRNRINPDEKWFGALAPNGKYSFDSLGVLISTRHVIFSYRQFDKIVDITTECPNYNAP